MVIRQIVLDTETTGLSASEHRIIEIGCIEIINRRVTGKHFHAYLQPDRAIDPGAERVHGISSAFLKGKPRFKEVMTEFLAYIEGAELIIHNAPFDTSFLNAEFRLAGLTLDTNENYTIIDTLSMARKKHPGQKNNLDALCKRYQVNNEHRQLHGALLDAQILADVYLAMTAGQEAFAFENHEMDEATEKDSAFAEHKQGVSTPIILATATELADHSAFMEQLR